MTDKSPVEQIKELMPQARIELFLRAAGYTVDYNQALVLENMDG